MSISGMTETMKISGKSISVLASFDDALPKTYPSAKCPTANDLLASD